MLLAIFWTGANKMVTLCCSGHALRIWICWCSLFYRRELWASKSAGFHAVLKASKSVGARSDVFVVCALAAPVLRLSLLLAPNGCNKLKILYLTAPIFLLCPPFQMMIIMLYQQGIPLADTLLESRILPNLYAAKAKLQILVLFSQFRKWTDFKTGQVQV